MSRLQFDYRYAKISPEQLLRGPTASSGTLAELRGCEDVPKFLLKKHWVLADFNSLQNKAPLPSSAR